MIFERRKGRSTKYQRYKMNIRLRKDSKITVWHMHIHMYTCKRRTLIERQRRKKKSFRESIVSISIWYRSFFLFFFFFKCIATKQTHECLPYFHTKQRSTLRRFPAGKDRCCNLTVYGITGLKKKKRNWFSLVFLTRPLFLWYIFNWTKLCKATI